VENVWVVAGRTTGIYVKMGYKESSQPWSLLANQEMPIPFPGPVRTGPFIVPRGGPVEKVFTLCNDDDSTVQLKWVR
jgi:hypothetical protein